MTDEIEASFKGAISGFLSRSEEANTPALCKDLLEKLHKAHGMEACEYFVKQVVEGSEVGEQVHLITAYAVLLTDNELVDHAMDWADAFITAVNNDYWVGATQSFYTQVVVATHTRDYELTIKCLAQARKTAWMIRDEIERLHAFIDLYGFARSLAVPQENEDYLVANDIQRQALARKEYHIVAHYCLALGALHESTELFKRGLDAAQLVTNPQFKARIEGYIEELVAEGHEKLLKLLIRNATSPKLRTLAQRELDAQKNKKELN